MNKRLIKWICIHKSTSNIYFYSLISPCPLPIKKLSSILKSSKVSGQLRLKNSLDSNVSSAKIEVTAGKWSASEMTGAESRLECKKIFGYHQNNRTGLGPITTQKIPPKNTQDYWKLIFSVVEKSDDGKLHAKSVQLSLQGQRTRWCDYIKLDLSGKNFLAMLQPLLSFCLGATYDTLPSTSNLYRWYIAPETVFSLSKTSLHISSHSRGIRVALQKGIFSFRHDAVLRVLAPSIKSFLTSCQVSNNKFSYIKFVKAGSRLPKTSKKATADCYIVHQTGFFCLILSLH